MIFVTVGTQLPFERLVRAVDQWAGENKQTKVFIQSGETSYIPLNCEFKAYTEPSEWEELFVEASVVVSHAGMGTILKSIDFAKPLIIMPRKASLGEHRNDHQLATAEKFVHLQNVKVVLDDLALFEALNAPEKLKVDLNTSNANLSMLIQNLQNFIQKNA